MSLRRSQVLALTSCNICHCKVKRLTKGNIMLKSLQSYIKKLKAVVHREQSQSFSTVPVLKIIQSIFTSLTSLQNILQK